ncbi:hypothetical protein FHU38_003487 [Saccharomonospora amisosensis]|uniref:ANTAR domain-containing protein n=1 Tax=Saccharomonospora amisosensis TaxID=1128677 RepID=A0A7X5US32_9PSEU|nr:GAF and ANTAR domain-containing protein [Saccharomonospora amisosensis]NIJ13143.1 hypothetical protein [Saccharomonospora amisosensis]
MHREVALASAFAALADAGIGGLDETEYAHALALRCRDLLAVDEAAALLADERLRVQALAATTDTARELTILQADTVEGPAVESLRSAMCSGSADLRHESRWAAFTASALNTGFTSAHTLPLCGNGQVVGALMLLRHGEGSLADTDRAIGQALADTAAATVLSRRTLGSTQQLAGQLQTALHTRVTIEQAKGVLATRLNSDLESAFEVMRSFARRTRRRLAGVAQDVIDDAPSVRHLATAEAPRRGRQHEPRPYSDAS